MKRKIFLTLALCLVASWSMAQAPKWVEKAKQAVFSIATYDQNDQLLKTGNGFFVSEDGIALSDYALFKGAKRAVIINSKGEQMPVLHIMGADDMYDVVKFRVDIPRKVNALPIASASPNPGAEVYLLPYSTQKSRSCTAGHVKSVDKVEGDYAYYTLEMQLKDKMVSCPVTNAEGEVFGLVQKSSGQDTATLCYAVDTRYAMAQKISALSYNDLTLTDIGIKKALPDTEEQAVIFLYMASSQLDQNEYLNLLNEFIRKYPGNSEGYSRRATLYMSMNDETHYKQADEDLKQMLEVSENKAEGHYGIAKQIYNYVLSLNGKRPYGNWTLEHALSEINEAIKIDNQGLYYQLQGDINFALQKYSEAFASYDFVNRSPIASAASFYSAAKTKELMDGASKKEAIALMDSAVARFITPYGNDAAPYLYERARMKSEDGQYREAVMDYNAFYDAMMGQVTAEFYLIREQAEMQCRMYQQAVNDINKAVEMDAENGAYWVEKGSVHLRVNQLDEAINALQKAIRLNQNDGSVYRMLGYAQINKGNRQEGLANLEKAQQLGDTVASDLIKKYKK